MKEKNCLIFGGSGQIGRNLIRKLTKNNYRVTVVTRNVHTAGYKLKTQANPGYLKFIELKNFNLDKIDELMKNASICINLIGILFEKRRGNTFQNIHNLFPTILSKLAKFSKFPIEVVVGPEFITGSTRMKAGTAQKMILNIISTTLMIRLGRVKGNKMVDMQLSNNKLVDRAEKMLMNELKISLDEAKKLLQKHKSVRKSIENFKT